MAIDTQVFIWGIKKEANAEQGHMVPKTQAFLNYLWKNHYHILVPSPVIGEVLTPVPLTEHSKLLAQIDRLLQIVPFDTAAAGKFAEMMSKYLEDKELRGHRHEYKILREVVKVDYMIAAIAVSRHAETIYSNDSDIAKFASSFIEVKTIPDVPVQVQLFSQNPDYQQIMKP